MPASNSKATRASKAEKKALKAQSDSELSEIEDEISVEVVNQFASTDHDDVDSDNPSEAGQTSEEEWTGTKSKQSSSKRKSGSTKAKTGKPKRKSQPQSDSESEDKPAKRVKVSKKNGKKGKETAVEGVEASEGDEEVEGQEEEDSDYQAQDLLPIQKKKGKTPFKRRKKKKVKHVKGKRGMLKAVLDLPIECFSLIADHLDHKDLYNLAQVNKFFKDMLSAASADHIWQDAADRDGIPELAVPMTNMQLAHLLFVRSLPFVGVRLTNEMQVQQGVLRVRPLSSPQALIRAAHRSLQGVSKDGAAHCQQVAKGRPEASAGIRLNQSSA